MSSSTFPLTVLDGEPRVHDLALAERLEFSQAIDIRKLIRRNEDKLLKFGVLATVAKTSSDQGGRPSSEFYLNQKQSIFICMKSETDKAFDVQAEIVRVFDAYLNGDLSATVATQPRMYAVARNIARSIGLERDAGAKQALIYQLQSVHRHLGLPMPALHLFGKSADQMQMEF